MSNILVIDDKKDNLVSLSALLKTVVADCNVITAQSGADGIKKAEAELPDTILLDIKMPGMDGYEVCKRLKNSKKTKHIPVIMISAIKTESEDVVRGFDTGADAYLAKPVDPYVLAAQVNTALRIKNAESLLRDQKELLASLVRERTAELVRSNTELKNEINDRKQIEKQLRESEQWLKKFSNLTFEGILLHDKGVPIDVNESFLRIFGYVREEVVGKNVIDLYIPSEYQAAIKHRIAKKIAKPFEVVGKKKDGTLIPIEIESVDVTYGNEEFRVVAIRDITERKKTETQRAELEAQLLQAQKMEAIGTLAGGIAHDFNNILSSILGYTDLSIEEVDEKSILHEYLIEVLSAGNRAKDLVRQILFLSRHDPSETRPFQINQLVKEIFKMLRATIPTSIEIKENICRKPLMVYGDATQIHQVIVNLATNAKQAMSSDDTGLIEVCVDPVRFDESIKNKHPDAAPGDYVKITISDTGAGIPATHLDKIFEPYFTTKKMGEGTGLGLFIVHGIIKSHKGQITVNSQPDKGVTFNIYLPLAKKQSVELPPRIEEPLPTGTEHILLVDDEPSIVKMMQVSLKRLGYTVTSRVSSIEALAAFRSSPDKFDLVMTDMAMPNMTGDKLACEIKKIRPDMPM